MVTVPGRGEPWLFFLSTFVYFPTSRIKSRHFPLKVKCFVMWGVGGQVGNRSEGWAPSSSPFPMPSVGLRAFTRQLWRPALTFWNSVPAHVASGESQDQRSPRPSPGLRASRLRGAPARRPPRLLARRQPQAAHHLPGRQAHSIPGQLLPVSKFFLIWRRKLSLCCFSFSSPPSLGPGFWVRGAGLPAPPCPAPGWWEAVEGSGD